MTITVGTKIKITNTDYPSSVPNGSIMTVTNHIFDGTVYATVDGVGGYAWCIRAGTYEVLEDDVQVGTLAELDVKAGDVVEFVEWHDNPSDAGSFAYGKRYTVKDDKIDSGRGFFLIDTPNIFRIVSRATDTPKTFGELTDAEQAALLLAHHRGISLQMLIGDDWFDPDGIFSVNLAYRVAPPKPVVETVTMRVFHSGNGWCSDHMSNPTHRITFDTIDGVPDTGSIKMVEV